VLSRSEVYAVFLHFDCSQHTISCFMVEAAGPI
jgi:hypothetical protein